MSQSQLFDAREFRPSTVGKLWFSEDHWNLQCEPHAAMWAKRIFCRINTGSHGTLKIKHTPAIARDLEWFSQRFPLDIVDRDMLLSASRAHVEKLATLDQIVGGKYTPRHFGLAIPLRRYQQQAAELYLANGSLLLGDDVGLGKTASAIASFTDPRTLPAVVVTLAHLPRQWAKEISRFAPDLFTHVIKKGQPYDLPERGGRRPDVLIINYHKLSGWADVLAKYCRSVTFDEIQELRRDGSQKYLSAKHIADAVPFKIGLSATPIYNYGGEIFNVVNVLADGALGTRNEFGREWCTGYQIDKQSLRQPAAFGSWLREQKIMLRRTRSDVGRELPALQRITQDVDSDASVFDGVEDAASELARIILSDDRQERGAKMQAAEEFNTLMRQATGLAKAPYVAAFVKLLIENGERVLLYGWHRAVYSVWKDRLREFNPSMYTGSESPSQKQEAIERFTSGETPLLMMSLRAGAGVDGLQKCCRTVVFGEFDWSPGVHEQCIGRVYRDGQPDPVAAYFMLADSGVDPIIAEVIGLKREQVEGLRNAGKESGDLERLERGDDGIRRLAEAYTGKVARSFPASD